MAWPHAGFPCSSNSMGYFSSFLLDVDTEICCQDRSACNVLLPGFLVVYIICHDTVSLFKLVE